MKLINGDCLQVMEEIPENSVDMILTDLPYGTTACSWDAVIPFEPLWNQYNRIIKDGGVVALFGQEPFSSRLRISNIKNYKYDWVWEKTMAVGFLNANRKPLRAYECISIFSNKGITTYNPQFTYGHKPYKNIYKNNAKDGVYRKYIKAGLTNKSEDGRRYPRNVIKFSNPNNHSLHPTQKPVPLLEYLIKTYTNKGETVLDSCMGSGSTGVACVNTGRDFIGIELDQNYYEIAVKRIREAEAAPKQLNIFEEQWENKA